MGEAKDILYVKNLSVTFDEHTIFENLNFEIPRDSIIAVIGPNGSGKTVLFRALLGLIPYKGEIKWNFDARIGYVPQKLSVQKDIPLTVMEFLKLKGASETEVGKAISLVGFRQNAPHIHHDVRVLKAKLGNLSGGELQRVLMAYALMGDPNVLLLDEPTAGVDIEGEETFYELFGRLKRDKDLTIIFISHDMEIVKTYADKVIKLTHEH